MFEILFEKIFLIIYMVLDSKKLIRMIKTNKI